MDQASYDAIRDLLEEALANADDETARHSIRNALQLLVRAREEARADED